MTQILKLLDGKEHSMKLLKIDEVRRATGLGRSTIHLNGIQKTRFTISVVSHT